jgi:hypothetical protein
MGWNFKDAGGGAAQGALAGGSMFGPAGAIGGGLLGLAMGGMHSGPPTAEEMGVNPLDINAEAQALMPNQSETNNQRNEFNAGLDGEIEKYRSQLIASGMDPTQAAQLAQNKFMSQRNRFGISQQQGQANMHRGLMAQMLPAKLQRDEDILNINNNQKFAPSFNQSMAPMTAGFGLQGIFDRTNGTGFFKPEGE